MSVGPSLISRQFLPSSHNKNLRDNFAKNAPKISNTSEEEKKYSCSDHYIQESLLENLGSLRKLVIHRLFCNIVELEKEKNEQQEKAEDLKTLLQDGHDGRGGKETGCSITADWTPIRVRKERLRIRKSLGISPKKFEI